MYLKKRFSFQTDIAEVFRIRVSSVLMEPAIKQAFHILGGSNVTGKLNSKIQLDWRRSIIPDKDQWAIITGSIK